MLAISSVIALVGLPLALVLSHPSGRATPTFAFTGVVSDVTNDWAFVVDGKFLRLKTRSVPRDMESSAEVHEDVGYLSVDTD